MLSRIDHLRHGFDNRRIPHPFRLVGEPLTDELRECVNRRLILAVHFDRTERSALRLIEIRHPLPRVGRFWLGGVRLGRVYLNRQFLNTSALRPRRASLDRQFLLAAFDIVQVLQERRDFDLAEPGQIKVVVQLEDAIELRLQLHLVPTGVERELVVGDHVRSPLSVGKSSQHDARHRRHPCFFRCPHAPFACDDRISLVDQDRVREPKFGDRSRDLGDLRLAVCTGVVAVLDQVGDLACNKLRQVRLDWRGDHDPIGMRTVSDCAHFLNSRRLARQVICFHVST